MQHNLIANQLLQLICIYNIQEKMFILKITATADYYSPKTLSCF